MSRMKFGAPDHEDRTLRFSKDRFGYTAVVGMRETATPVRSHDDQVCRLARGRVENGIAWKSPAHEVI